MNYREFVPLFPAITSYIHYVESYNTLARDVKSSLCYSNVNIDVINFCRMTDNSRYFRYLMLIIVAL